MHAGNVSPGENSGGGGRLFVLTVKIFPCRYISLQSLFGFGGKTRRQRHSGGTGWGKGMALQKSFLSLT